MNTVHSIFGDQPADVLRGAVDEVLDVIKNQNKTGVCVALTAVCVWEQPTAPHTLHAACLLSQLELDRSPLFPAAVVLCYVCCELSLRRPLCADHALSLLHATCFVQTRSARRSVRSCWARCRASGLPSWWLWAS